MSARLEAFLARLYTEAAARAELLADPRGAATRAGLSAAEIDALAAIDRPGLELAARSFDRKRAHGPRPPSGWRRRLAALRQRASMYSRR